MSHLVHDLSKSGWDRKDTTALRCKGAAAVIVLSTLTACAGSTTGALTTGSLEPAVKSASETTSGQYTPVSDEAVVGNTVSAAEPTGADIAVPWANSATGSTGVIRSIEETRASDTVCRTFRTSRHGYDGIALFSGKTCRDGNDTWTVLSFRSDAEVAS